METVPTEIVTYRTCDDAPAWWSDGIVKVCTTGDFTQAGNVEVCSVIPGPQAPDEARMSNYVTVVSRHHDDTTVTTIAGRFTPGQALELAEALKRSAKEAMFR